jgi:hypothetical protein
MPRWGKRWLSVPGESGPVPGTRRVGGRYVAAAKGEKRPRGPGGEKMRSGWEVNFACLLRYLKIPYAYEPRKFVFHAILSGTRVMTPDFYLPQSRQYVEVKGYMDRRSRTAIARFRKYYPRLTLVVVDAPFFRRICAMRLCVVIPGWTCRHTARFGSIARR